MSEIGTIKHISRYKPVAARLVVKEYLPLGGWLLGWFLVGLAIGHANAVRLLAAQALVQAVRAIGMLESGQVLASRVDSDAHVYRKSRSRAWRFELAGLLISAILLGGLVACLYWRGMEEAALMTAIVGASIPARHPGLLLVANRNRVAAWRNGGAVAFVVGGGLVLGLGLHWTAAAIVMASRDWVGLFATLLFAARQPPRPEPPTEPLRFSEVAGRTEASARKRLSYRLIKSLASVVLGPFGNFAARTGREVGKIDSRLARFVPRNRPSMILFTLGTAGAAFFFLVISSEPAAILAGAAFARLAATGAAAVIWWRYRTDQDEEDDDE